MPPHFFDDLVLIAFANNAIDQPISTAINLMHSDNRRWARRMKGLFGESDPPPTPKGSAIPTIPQSFQNARIERLKKLREKGLL